MKRILLVAAAFLIGSSLGVQAAGSKNRPEGSLQITVIDEKGAVVTDAPVYIFGEYRTHFVGGNQTKGTAFYRMPAGDYRVSSSLTEEQSGYKQRYASDEAHVQIISGDNVSVILTLRSIPDPFAVVEGYSQLSKVTDVDTDRQPL